MKKKELLYSCANVRLDHQSLTLLIDALQTTLLRHVYDCDDTNVVVLFDLLARFKKLRESVQGPF
jgi:hypothetical protein